MITGCDSGFGNLIAKQLDKKGCCVYAACFTTRGASDLKAVSSDRLKTIQLDVTSSESIKAAYEEVKRHIPEGEGKISQRILISRIESCCIVGNNYGSRCGVRPFRSQDKMTLVRNTGIFLYFIEVGLSSGK